MYLGGEGDLGFQLTSLRVVGWGWGGGGRFDCENGGKDAFYWCFVVTQLKGTDTKTSAEHGSRANRRRSAGPAGRLYQQVHLRSLSFI